MTRTKLALIGTGGLLVVIGGALVVRHFSPGPDEIVQEQFRDEDEDESSEKKMAELAHQADELVRTVIVPAPNAKVYQILDVHDPGYKTAKMIDMLSTRPLQGDQSKRLAALKRALQGVEWDRTDWGRTDCERPSLESGRVYVFDTSPAVVLVADRDLRLVQLLEPLRRMGKLRGRREIGCGPAQPEP